ncbi:hypothetical protein WJX72_009322 [[Myrmecia] bisecta]|uniref:Uncharacterized protein n=1 Tax=[Myrmecia] bisecta TaxID=41462 RepID=A0AAW1QS78_9CHLO
MVGIHTPTFQDIERHLETHGGVLSSSRTGFQQLLEGFVTANEDPATSTNFNNGLDDYVDCITNILTAIPPESDEATVLVLLKVLKIISRKQTNRQRIGEHGIYAVLKHLRRPANPKVAAEGANVILNVCYEKANVDLVLRCNGVPPLIKFLSHADADVQANAAGAVQSICFQEKGRQGVRDAEAVPALIALLRSPQAKVKARAVGALHNLSSDSGSIRIIRRNEGIPKLVDLLRSDSWAVCGSAAGALQNVSREVASRMLIRELDAVCPLADLLSAPDLQAQVCAAGALLNILGPEIDRAPEGAAQRQGLARLMSCVVSLSVVHEAMYDSVPALDTAVRPG